MAFDLIASPARGKWHVPMVLALIGVVPRDPGPAYTAGLAQPVITGDWLVQAPGLGMRYSFTFEDGIHFWEHRLLDISDIEVSTPPGGGLATVANVTISVIESNDNVLQGGILYRWNQATAVDGAAITIDFLLDGTTESLRVFTGRIDTVTLTGAISTLLCVDDSIHRDVLLPQQLLMAAEWPNADERARTQPVPLVYGWGGRGLTPPLLLVDVPTNTYLVAAHPMALISTFALFAPEVNRFLRFSTAATLTPLAALARLPTPLQEQRLNQVSNMLVVQAQVGVSAATQAIDGNSTTIATVSTSALDSSFDGIGILEVTALAAPLQRGNNTLMITLTKHRRAPASDPTVTGTFVVYTFNPLTGTILRDNLFTTQQFRHALNPLTTAFTPPAITLGEAETLGIRLTARNEGGIGGVSNVYHIGDIAVESVFQPTGDAPPLYMEGLLTGRYDLTGTIVSYAGLGAGTIFAYADQIIASILQQEMGLAIHPGMFAVAYNYYAAVGYVLDGGIGAGWPQTRQHAHQVLDDLARQSRALLVPTFAGTWGLRVYRGAASPRFHFDTARILQAAGAEARIGQPPQSTFSVTLGNLEQVHNRYELHYHYNTGSRQYDRVFTVDQTGTNVPGGDDLVAHCIASVQRHGILTPLVLEASWVRDNNTAAMLIRHLVEYFSTPRLTVQFETTMVAAALQVGESIIVTYPALPPGDNGGIFEIHTMRYKPLQGRIALVASKPSTLQRVVVSVPARAQWKAVLAIHPDPRAALISPARAQWRAVAATVQRVVVSVPARAQWRAVAATVSVA